MTCKVDGCSRPNYTSGWCHAHYARKLKHGDVLAHIPIGQLPGKPTRKGEPCDVPGCGKAIEARNWCRSHYRSWLAHGDPEALRIRNGYSNGECLTCVDAVHLLNLGESVELTAARLGLNGKALLNHLRDHGRRDVAERVA
jgi:hypothetical protein